MRLISEDLGNSLELLPEKEGKLKKRTDNLIKTWNERVVAVKNRQFMWSKQYKDGLEIKGILNFDLYCCTC